MIPIGDSLPTRRVAWVNYLIIGITAVVWLLVQGGGADPDRLAATVCNFGMVPGELTHLARLGTAIPIAPGMACLVDNNAINWLTPFISIFLHGSWGHIIGNMLFLAVFGDNIEDAMGHGRYLAFYIVCGLVAGTAHIISSPASPVPTVGASGAISGIMGAYLLLYPKADIRMLFFIFVANIRAWLVLIYWFLLQLFQGLTELVPGPDVSGGVAVWAHVAGFVTGLLLVHSFVDRNLLARPFRAR